MTGGNAFTAERAISRPRDTTPHRLTAPDHGVGVAVVSNRGGPDVDPIGCWSDPLPVAASGLR